MKIKIESEGYRFTIPLPMRLAFNGITVRIMASCIEKYTDTPIKAEYLKVLMKELICAKRLLGSLVLVDVSSSDGSKVKIML